MAQRSPAPTIRSPLIAEVLVKGSRFDIVRPRQSYEELIGLDHIASWQEKRRG